MSKNREFPTTIILKDGRSVLAPPEFDARKPDPQIIRRLEGKAPQETEVAEEKT